MRTETQMQHPSLHNSEDGTRSRLRCKAVNAVILSSMASQFRLRNNWMWSFNKTFRFYLLENPTLGKFNEEIKLIFDVNY